MEFEFAWMRVAKVGTRSLDHLLRSEVADYTYQTRREPPSPEAQALLSGAGFRFAIVRNPWDRLLSAWSDKIAERPGRSRRSEKYVKKLQRELEPGDVAAAMTHFPSFVRLFDSLKFVEGDPHFEPQAKILGAIELDYEGRFEHFGESVTHALESSGLGHLASQLGHRNRTSTNTPYSAWYDDDAREVVATLFACDIDRWGYRFD